MVDEQPEEERDRNEADAESESDDAGRREFIKKLPYVAPVIQTFLFSEGALAGGNQRGNQRRNQRGVSPKPGQRKPPPPPPANDDDD